MTNIALTEQPAAWQVVEQTWRNWYPHSRPLIDQIFVIDRSVPSMLVDEPEVTLTREQARAALEYWRVNMIKAVEEVAAQYRAEISTRLSEPEEGGL